MGVGVPRLAGILGAPLCVVSLMGCVPPPLPPPEKIAAALSYAVLQPEATCEELRDDFELYDLAVADSPDDLGLQYTEYLVSAANGEHLRVWHIPAQDSRGTVVISPGNSGPMACYLFTALLLTDGGWSVVMYDYEGFGGSTGQASLLTMRWDLETVVDWARAQIGVEQVSLFGMSLGSIPTVAVAVDRPDAINAIVLDSPVALGQQIERFGWVVRGRVQEVIALLDAWLITERIISGMSQPALVFTHANDFITPSDMAAIMLSNAVAPVEIVEFEELGHAEGQFLQTEAYAARLYAFLNTVWN